MQQLLMGLTFGSLIALILGTPVVTTSEKELLVARSLQVPINSAYIPRGYDFHPMQWELPTPGGGTIFINGTIEEAVELFRERFPGFEFMPAREESEKKRRDLEKRTDFSNSAYVCDNFAPAYLAAIHLGIIYLLGVPGQPGNGPGPGNCGRVSCSGNSAIWWCNDNPWPHQLYSYGSIADGANWIAYKCWYNAGGVDKVHGQVFHHTNWNVIVRDAQC